MRLIANPSGRSLAGELKVPGDKSISHRAVLLATLADGVSEIRGFLAARDTEAMAAACRLLGAGIHNRSDEVLEVVGAGLHGLRKPERPIDLGNSGTAMRLLAGVLSAQPFSSRLVGDHSLSARPMKRVIEPLTAMGASIASDHGTAPLSIAGGTLSTLEYRSPVASAQIKSCLLLAGLCAGVEVSVQEPEVSRNHSELMLASMGADLKVQDLRVTLRPVRRLDAVDFQVPGDPSSAAFPLAAACLMPDSRVQLSGVCLNPTRTGFLQTLDAMGARVEVHNQRTVGGERLGDILIAYCGTLKGLDVPPEWVPSMIDELPILMALAATADGRTRIRGAAELRVKESDRIAVMARGLATLGVSLEEFPDGIDIHGGPVAGGRVDAAHDHRCAMSFLVLGQAASAPVAVDSSEMIGTSWPGFRTEMVRLGADIRSAGGES